MALNHTSTVSSNEPPWAEVDQDRLPRNAAADMGEVRDPSTWKLKHHHVLNGQVGTSGVFTKGQMFLHKKGLKIALSETRRLDKNNHTRAHVLAHARAIGLTEKEASSALLQQIQGKMERNEADNHSALTDIRGIVEAVHGINDVESLTSLGNQILLACSTKEKAEKSWMGKEQMQSLSRQAQQLISHRRRQIMSMPDIKKAREDYELGKAIGLAK